MGYVLSEINCNVCLINSIWLYSPLFFLPRSRSLSLSLSYCAVLCVWWAFLSPYRQRPNANWAAQLGEIDQLGNWAWHFAHLFASSRCRCRCLSLLVVVCFHFAIAQPSDSSVAKSSGRARATARARAELSQSKRPAVAAERFIEHSVVVVAVAARTGFCLNL